MRPICTILILTLTSCALSPKPLAPDARGRLEAPAPGARIYQGQVTWEGESAPGLSYERWVEPTPTTWTSTHVTLRERAPILTQRATHSPTYELLGVEEIHGQLGLTSKVRVSPDGGLEIIQTQAGRTWRTHEAAGPGTLATGPTIFGLALRWWDALASGETRNIRFVVPEHARSYGFRLKMVREEDTSVVVMEPTGWLERVAIAPMRITFEAKTRRVLRYEGAVPPRDDALEVRRASVVYTHVSAQYR